MNKIANDNDFHLINFIFSVRVPAIAKVNAQKTSKISR